MYYDYVLIDGRKVKSSYKCPLCEFIAHRYYYVYMSEIPTDVFIVLLRSKGFKFNAYWAQSQRNIVLKNRTDIRTNKAYVAKHLLHTCEKCENKYFED